MPTNEATAKPRTIRLAKEARGSLEQLLESLGWPADDMALHRAVDRCLELEGEKKANASR
jgi:hypothetical protein